MSHPSRNDDSLTEMNVGEQNSLRGFSSCFTGEKRENEVALHSNI